MSLLSMPFLIINFGGEMIYILEQRLHAQNIQKEKSNKVLQDVTRAMFSQKFIAELLKPQGLYSNNATREIFDRLAHSSIMRLSESSMDKLYDLMTMGFKYQLVSCMHPREIIEITLNHLESIRTAVEGSPTSQQVEEAIAVFSKLCRELSSSEFAQIRQSLCGFFQDKRIKVSLFLQDKIQNSDGTIALPKGGPLPNDAGSETPGTIKYFDDAGNVASTERFDSPLAPFLGERLAGDPFDAASRDSKLGKNLYTVDRSKKKEAAKAAPAPAAASTGTSAQKLKEVKGAVVGELASLREMIGTSKPAESFSFPLFPETTEDPVAGNREISINAISREDIERTNAELKNIIDSMASAEVGGKEKDLLEMMDDAAAM